jgi:enoyl-CoA hydratase/carnithine racemase
MTDVTFERIGRIGYLTLCRTGTLNPLTLSMIRLLDKGLQTHETDPQVKAIVIRSAHPKAFCAGGDMKLIRELVLAERHAEVEEFFQQEYALNLRIARCSKPYIALINGIAMGGGLGMTVHGSYQIVSEQALLAMPESHIGFFPDVGGSFFLPRLPLNAGYWLAYTATAVHAADAVQAGLATHYVEHEQWPRLIAKLEQSDGAPIQHILDDYASRTAAEENLNLVARSHWFASYDVKSITLKLTAAAETSTDAAQLLVQLRSASPHSLALTQALFENAAGKDLETCQQQEMTAATAASRHADFIEGVRAVLVDKDRNPQWLTSP